MNRERQRFELIKAAMNGMLAGRTNASDEQIAMHSCNIADAVLAQLDRTKPKAETPKADADGWIAHRPGDPMPCDGGMMVSIRCRDGYTERRHASHFGPTDKSPTNWWTGEPILNPGDQIIAWKPA